jgi:hypothetical protein
MIFLLKKLKNFLKKISIIFQEYSRNIFPKAITKVLKKQVGVARVIFFAPNVQSLKETFKFSLLHNIAFTPHICS